MEFIMDWSALGKALAFYEAVGFKYIDVPWYTDPSIIELTWPKDKPRVSDLQLCKGYELVASAEQGFIALSSQLEPGRYVSCSPCFRVEPIYDHIHKPYFMKVELYSSFINSDELEFILHSAEEWYSRYGVLTRRVFFDDDSVDLECNNIELGSYGIRKLQTHSFIYGTGHAEPRTSDVLNGFRQQT